MKFLYSNFKEIVLSVEDVEKQLSILLTDARNQNAGGVKIMHGYGSHGHGGVICVELRRELSKLKRKKAITDFLCGNEWDISSEKCQKFLVSCPAAANDEDLNKSNPGITIIVL